MQKWVLILTNPRVYIKELSLALSSNKGWMWEYNLMGEILALISILLVPKSWPGKRFPSNNGPRLDDLRDFLRIFCWILARWPSITSCFRSDNRRDTPETPVFLSGRGGGSVVLETCLCRSRPLLGLMSLCSLFSSFLGDRLSKPDEFLDSDMETWLLGVGRVNQIKESPSY